jgi:GT2 family glycosyltransferase
MKPSLDIVIVNWNAGAQLRECLESIAASELAAIDLRRVVVVDNASTDGSARGLPDVGGALAVVRNPENRGFGAACNQGAAGSRADYLLFLNPDTALRRDSLAVPLSFMESPANAGVGICGISLTDRSGRVARSCSRFPTTLMFLSKMVGAHRLLPAALARQPMTEWDHATSRDVDQVIGAYFLVRRALFEELHGFDERFFVYFEEVDFSLRASARGMRSHFLATASALHVGGGCSNQVRARRLTYNLRSRIEYALKHFPGASAAALVLGTLLVEPFTRMVAALLRRSSADFGETFLAYRELWRQAPGLVARALRRG